MYSQGFLQEEVVEKKKEEVVELGGPGGSDSKETVCNAGEPGSIPGSGRSPREENDRIRERRYDHRADVGMMPKHNTTLVP